MLGSRKCSPRPLQRRGLPGCLHPGNRQRHQHSVTTLESRSEEASPVSSKRERVAMLVKSRISPSSIRPAPRRAARRGSTIHIGHPRSHFLSAGLSKSIGSHACQPLFRRSVQGSKTNEPVLVQLPPLRRAVNRQTMGLVTVRPSSMPERLPQGISDRDLSLFHGC